MSDKKIRVLFALSGDQLEFGHEDLYIRHIGPFERAYPDMLRVDYCERGFTVLYEKMLKNQYDVVIFHL